MQIIAFLQIIPISQLNKIYRAVAKRSRHRILIPAFVGSNPTSSVSLSIDRLCLLLDNKLAISFTQCLCNNYC